MYNNELVTAVTIWTVGYVVGQIPSNILLSRVDPRWVIPTVCTLTSERLVAKQQLELGWGIATLGSYGVKSYRALYALRFLVGLFEYVSTLYRDLLLTSDPDFTLVFTISLDHGTLLESSVNEP